eukprot:m.111068 g.111068  ORF g.111068 m.111068 type:complete len:74 (+) comp22753_c1_seq2:2089-2310(+)
MTFFDKSSRLQESQEQSTELYYRIRGGASQDFNSPGNLLIPDLLLCKKNFSVLTSTKRFESLQGATTNLMIEE